jgi:multicomponent Na+:H+ antiporter subunit D
MITVWKLNEALSLSYRFDDFSRIFLLLAAVLFTAGFVYSLSYMKEKEHKARYYTFYILLFSVICLMSLAANFITFYLNYELMTLLSVPLVMHDGTEEARVAGFKYLFYSFAGAYCVLFGFFVLNKYCEDMDFIYGRQIDLSTIQGHEGLVLFAVFMMILGFSVKAGMWPMHAWLTKAHPIAPAPASAILSGVIVKSGVAGIIRVVYYIIGADFIRGTWVQYTFLSLTLITILMGSTLAFFEPVLKRRLAYSTISQISYILFGIALLNDEALKGGDLQFLAHGFAKCALFLIAGIFIHVTHEDRVDKMLALGRKYPFITFCYLIASLSMIGIPPTGGFIGKWYLMLGSMNAEIRVFSVLGAAVLLISALLTAGYLLPLGLKGFFPGSGYLVVTTGESVSKLEAIPVAILTIMALLVGIFPGIFV